MAEGGDYPDIGIDEPIDHPDDHDDQETLNSTRPFQPGQSSTPYHVGEQIPMQTMQHEHSGLPSYEETSFGGDQSPLLDDFLSPEEKKSKVEKAIDFIKKRFPKADFRKIGPIAFSKKGTKSEIVSLGPKGGETKIFKQDGSGFQKGSQTNFQNLLGKARNKLSPKTAIQYKKIDKDLRRLKKKNERQKKLLQQEKKNYKR